MSVEALVAHFGYLALLIGVLLEGEVVLVVAAALAHRGDLSLPIVVLVAFGGSVVTDQASFHFGRRYGGVYLAQHGRLRARSAFVERWLARYGSAFVVGFRFLYGLRTATPLLLGAAGYPPRSAQHGRRRAMGVRLRRARIWDRVDRRGALAARGANRGTRARGARGRAPLGPRHLAAQ